MKRTDRTTHMPDGEPASSRTPAQASDDEPEAVERVEILVDDPAELIRLASMLNRLNTELQEIDLDQHTVDRIEALHRQVIEALEANLHESLVAELHRFVPALRQQSRSESDVRVAHLLLVGWIEGLFQGMQLTAIGNQLREFLVRQQQQSQQPAENEQRPGRYI